MKHVARRDRTVVAMPTVAILLLASLALVGCQPLQPWVKPGQRAHLEEPVMSLAPNPVAERHLDRILACGDGAGGASDARTGGSRCH